MMTCTRKLQDTYNHKQFYTTTHVHMLVPGVLSDESMCDAMNKVLKPIVTKY